ncbi:hypothetical protein [Amycolatopsis australiensis]|uniref:Uncharacterized protein n=1 Tax=Amycolatopsis australiensis TaxID=546364 RepID=A0A1K1R642_9PSEU|nr:hypothetical protein [Amycolatopsis australiensis]SFW67722.1 hypothetical protein SAMN04489730_2765 [Amycolatopsis australiensis]
MEEAVAGARRMIEEQRSVFDLLELLHKDTSFRCTPFNFLRVCTRPRGFRCPNPGSSWRCFDLDWRPSAPPAEIEQKWAAMISRLPGTKA